MYIQHIGRYEGTDKNLWSSCNYTSFSLSYYTWISQRKLTQKVQSVCMRLIKWMKIKRAEKVPMSIFRLPDDKQNLSVWRKQWHFLRNICEKTGFPRHISYNCLFTLVSDEKHAKELEVATKGIEIPTKLHELMISEVFSKDV